MIRTAFTGEHTPALLTQLLNSSKPRKEGFQYGNLGYVVASMVIERVTGKPWQRVFDDTVFAALEMHDTTAFMSEASRRPLAVPYDVDRRGVMQRVALVKNDQMMHAAGGIVTTPADLARWLAANVNHGRLDGRERLPAATFAEAHRQQAAVTIERDEFKASGYGFGWNQAQYGADPVLFHLGGFEGWRAHVSFMPGKKLGVAVVANAGGLSGRVLNDLAASIYDRLLENPDATSSSAARLATLKADLQKQRERIAADIETRSKRPWMLAHANDAYTGRYENALYGTLAIERHAEKLVATLASLRGELEAFTEPETARVELMPGSGSVLRFQVEGGVVKSLQWNGEVFERMR